MSSLFPLFFFPYLTHLLLFPYSTYQSLSHHHPLSMPLPQNPHTYTSPSTPHPPPTTFSMPHRELLSGRHPLSRGSIADFSGPSRMTIGYLEEFINDGQVLEEPADLDAVFEKQASVLESRVKRRKLEQEAGIAVAEGRLDAVLAK